MSVERSASATTTTVAAEARVHVVVRHEPHVTWDESVVDNEFLGRRSSKVCCIFRPRRAFGESDSESSSSSESESEPDSEAAGSAAQAPSAAGPRHRCHRCHHHHRPKLNAYERQHLKKPRT